MIKYKKIDLLTKSEDFKLAFNSYNFCIINTEIISFIKFQIDDKNSKGKINKIF